MQAATGINQGVQQNTFTIAKNMLQAGEPDHKIMAFTNIDAKALAELKKQ